MAGLQPVLYFWLADQYQSGGGFLNQPIPEQSRNGSFTPSLFVFSRSFACSSAALSWAFALFSASCFSIVIINSFAAAFYGVGVCWCVSVCVSQQKHHSALHFITTNHTTSCQRAFYCVSEFTVQLSIHAEANRECVCVCVHVHVPPLSA